MQTINKLECDAILFDLDGVLIDSTSCIIRHWKVWANKHNLDVNEIMQIAHGRRTVETIQLIAPYLDAEKEADEHTLREVMDTQGVLEIEGARELLTSLPANSWAIVTSGSSKLIKARLDHVALPLPEILVTSDDVKNGKPSPEPYLLGAKRLGVEVERSIIIEDAPAGIVAGKKAGMIVIGIKKTHSEKELLDSGADLVIDQLGDLHINKPDTGYRLVVETK